MHDATLARLVAGHLEIIQARYDDALSATGFDAALLGAGTAIPRFMDDQYAPFRTNPQLLQWLPVEAHPDACLLYRPGQLPVAVLVCADSYWEEPPAVPVEPWAELIDLRVVAAVNDVPGTLGDLPARTALLGPEAQWQGLRVAGDRNPEALVRHLDYRRACKTAYEQACMREASAAAANGHRAAADTFAGGGSEFEILLAFQRGSGQAAGELPYPPIVGTGTHAAVLHYQHYRQNRAPAGSLLIDAGCAIRGYASDVSRTHVLPGHEAFAALRDDLDRRQQVLCEAVRPGIPFARLHHAAHREVAGLLARHGLVRCSAETALERGLTQHFFPHGLGHLLGLQVHDVGGHQAGPDGETLAPPAEYPRLRLLRTLEPDFTLTIEPGIYFIPTLLAALRRQPEGAEVDWQRVAELQPMGGIRIEDNLLLTGDGAENLTRSAFAVA